MCSRRSFVLLGAALLLLTLGVALSSNMAFRWAPNWTVTNTDHWISLPYRGSWSTADDLCGVIPNVTLVSYFDSATGFRVDWACPFGGDFPIVPGLGVFVRVGASSSPVFVGSHIDDLEVPLGGFSVSDRDHFLSIPYHTTSSTAEDICAELPSATLVSRFDPETGVRSDWACPFGRNFSIRLGESLAVRVSEPGPGFIPSHY